MRARQVSLRSVRQTQCEGRFGRLHPEMSHAFTARLPAERRVLRQRLVSIRQSQVRIEEIGRAHV